MTVKFFAPVFAAATALCVSANAADSVEASRNANIDRMVSGVHSFYEEDGETLRGRGDSR